MKDVALKDTLNCNFSIPDYNRYFEIQLFSNTDIN